MNELGIQNFNDYRLLLVSHCQKVRLKAKDSIEFQEISAEIHELEYQWGELQKQYHSLVSYGYKENASFQYAQNAIAKITQQQILDALKENPQNERMWTLLSISLQEFELFLVEVELEWQERDSKRPFLVNFWSWSLQKLEVISLFYFIRNFFFPKYTKGNYRFVDSWLLGHTILAAIYIIVANIEAVPIGFKYALLIYGCLRMFEILIYQLNVILVHPYNNANYSLNSYRRMTIALIHNFIEIVFWFAGTFVTLQFITDASVPKAVYTSFIHMVTYSMDLDESKWTILAIFILQFQAAIGVFMTVLSLARFVSLFPQPASMDPKEQEANEVRHMTLLKELRELKATVENNSGWIDTNEKEDVKERS